ncbi:allophanate hydrolase [Hydrocarboniphaga sp.]|uniref:allophanate hydrolase n=1 Tax=Hydrocarboniphaga sp. TaxID=2033016 RepID=UPI00261DAD97|nr:allophanate hydrolase [Hydrocarboniphaga sp.]
MRVPDDLSLASLRAAYQAGDCRPRDLLAHLRQRALAANPEFHLYITLLDEAQLEPYLAALDERDPASLPLFGIPFAIKDNIDLAGVPTTAACPAYAYTPQASATAVQRLIDLGAVPTGKTNLDQFATGLNGLRSPYGECRNSVLPEYPSGGSSSGSSLAVALNLASFSLGTDTAGSGRVPAALNGLVGVKPTRGIVSTSGVVPCCRSLDCISLFSRSSGDVAQVLALLAQFDRQQPYSRRNPAWNAAALAAAPASFRFGVPRAHDLLWFGCDEGPALFDCARATLEGIGGVAVEIDLRPFMEAASLLYAAPGAAERYAAFGELIARQPDAVLPVIRDVVTPGAHATAVDRILAAERLQELKRICDQSLDALDLVLTPTIPRAYTREQIRAEPVLRNSELGTYTNFMNLLDYAAVAVPAGSLRNGLPWGITLFGRAYTDQYLLSIARAMQLQLPSSDTLRPGDRMRLVVCGAHLQGLALNHQLLTRGARLIEATRSAARYRLYALPGGPPARPAMARSASGHAIEVEVWELPSSEVGSFLAGIAAPLGLGKIELADGRFETGFICEESGVVGAADITEFGGWRAYRASTQVGNPLPT